MTSIGCSTCIESFTPRCNVSTTPCGHVFHTSCITQWLGTGHNNCPECRKNCTLGQIRKLYFSEVVKEDQIDLVTQLLKENEKFHQEVEKKESILLGQIRKLYFSEVEKEDQSDLVTQLLKENEKLHGAVEKKESTFGRVSQLKPTFGSDPEAETWCLILAIFGFGFRVTKILFK